MPAPKPSRTPDPAVAADLYEARKLRAQRRFAEAASRYKAVLAVRSDSAEALGGLGHTIGITGRPDRGIDLLCRAIEIDPRSAELHQLLASLYALKVEPARALEHLDRALEIEPGRVDALVLAAECNDRLNRKDKARALAERAVAARRTDPWANLVLGSLEAKAREFDKARPRLQKLIDRRSTPPDIHHRALTEMGFLLDRTGQHDAAYEAFDRAGSEIEQTPEAQRVSRTAAYDRLAAYRGRFSADVLGRFAGERFETPAPAFLVGFPRSGTTMTEQVIAAHPGAKTSDENNIINAVGLRLIEGGSAADVPERIARLDRGTVESLRRVYWDEAAAQLGPDASASLLVDKLPLNIIELPIINAVFPDAKVILALRDPRDCCLSCFMQWFAPNPAMIHLLHLPETVDFYAAVMGLYLETAPALTLPILRVRYEDTVSDLESQARRIIEHLDLDWHDDLLRFHEKARDRALRTPSYEAVTEPVHSRAIGRWQNYRRFFEPLLPKLTPFLDEFGYTTSRTAPDNPDLKRVF